MTAPNIFPKALLFAFYIALTACGGGGGGGGGGGSNADTTPPVITLTGSASVTITQNGTYTEAGATANDDIDGSVAVTIGGDMVDTATPGTYSVTYTATDAANNTASVTRTVIVADITPPVVTLTGSASVLVVQNDTYTEAGASASDDIDGVVTVTTGGDTVNTATLGSYSVTYTATDAANNTAVVTRTVVVILPLSFKTTWKTDNPGSSGDNEVTITTDGGLVYNYQVDWGDDQVDTNVSGDITHTYATAGTYTISISDDFPHFLAGVDNQKLLSVDQWSDTNWASMASAFSGATNFIVTAADTPQLSLVTDMSSMFQNAAIFDQSISSWDVSSVTNMNSMFNGASAFNQDIGSWDVSSVVGISFMFRDASAFNQDIGGWDVSSAETMNGMFSNVTLSTANYDALLAGWSAQTLQSEVTFDAGDSLYTNTAARNILTGAPNNWTITDGGM